MKFSVPLDGSLATSSLTIPRRRSSILGSSGKRNSTWPIGRTCCHSYS